MRPAAPLTSHERDRALRRVRAVAWTAGIAAAVVGGGLSVAAAHAFKGHHATAAPTTTPAPAPTATHRVHVPPAEHVPPIAGSPATLAPPQQAPTAAPPAPVPAAPPPVSGGS